MGGGGATRGFKRAGDRLFLVLGEKQKSGAAATHYG